MAILNPDIDSQFEFPQMPPQNDEFGWFEFGNIEGHQLISFESSFVDGYDALRQNYGINAFEVRKSVDGTTLYSVGGDLNF